MSDFSQKALQTKTAAPLRDRLRSEARDKFDTLDESLQELYRTEQCPMCGAHLTVRQLNRVILQNLPPICLKDYKAFNGQLEASAHLFNQLRLF